MKIIHYIMIASISSSYGLPLKKDKIKSKDFIQNIFSEQKDYFGRTPFKVPSNKKKKYVHLNPETGFGPEVITSFNFQNISLQKLTTYMQKLTGINLITKEDLQGSISISAPKPITVGDAWKAYLTALNINKYTFVKVGRFYNIIPIEKSTDHPIKIYKGDFVPDTSSYIIKILVLKNIKTTEMKNTLSLFTNKKNIANIQETNTLILRDTGSNINRLVKIVKMLDVPGHTESLQVIKIKHTSSNEILSFLNQILKLNGLKTKYSSQFKTTKIKMIISDPRTNSIIAMANKKGSKKLKSLIKKFDTKIKTTQSSLIHIYQLEYGDVDKIATILNNILENIKKNTASISTKKKFFLPKKIDNTTQLFSSNIKIAANKDHNALIVTATPTDYLKLKNVIKKLDRPREQVYVEGLIVETNIRKESKIGISLMLKNSITHNGINHGDMTSGSLQSTSSDMLKNLLTAPIAALSSFGGFFASRSMPQLKMLISAIATDNNINILANPQILAINNQEATFSVGEKIPIVVKSITKSGFQESLKYKKINLTLKIKPHINKQSQMINLEIEQTIENISQRSLPGNLNKEAYPISTSKTKTTVLVKNKDTIVMSGLMRDKLSLVESKVPLLGDIPILGWLFKHSEKMIEKVNLFFFLTPKILDLHREDLQKNTLDLLKRRKLQLQHLSGSAEPFKNIKNGMTDEQK